MGVERILELLKEEQLVPEAEGCDVYVVHQGDAAREQAFIIAERLRDTGLDVILHCSADGQIGQLQVADEACRRQRRGVRRGARRRRNRQRHGRREAAARYNANGGKSEQHNVPAEDLTEFLINAMVATAEDGDD